MPFIFKINVSLKKGDLKSTNISNIFNIFYIFYRNLFALGFLYAILTEKVGNNFKKNIGSCLGNPTTKNHFCHIRRAVLVLWPRHRHRHLSHLYLTPGWGCRVGSCLADNHHFQLHFFLLPPIPQKVVSIAAPAVTVVSSLSRNNIIIKSITFIKFSIDKINFEKGQTVRRPPCSVYCNTQTRSPSHSSAIHWPHRSAANVTHYFLNHVSFLK